MTFSNFNSGEFKDALDDWITQEPEESENEVDLEELENEWEEIENE